MGISHGMIKQQKDEEHRKKFGVKIESDASVVRASRAPYMAPNYTSDKKTKNFKNTEQLLWDAHIDPTPKDQDLVPDLQPKKKK